MPHNITNTNLVMFAEKNLPEALSQEELDNYLERGWYRTGQSMFTTHFLMFGYKKFYSAIWVRLPLTGFSFSKSNRKLLRKNCSRFRFIIREATLSQEAEALYQLYCANFPARLSPTLQESLLEGNRESIFRTMEFLAYDGAQLVAASYFDLGKVSISSILGIFHPDYAQYSLGYFTMLMEIAYGMENGFQYFYPGYVVPGYSRFDYKIRIGPIEYFDMQKRGWLPYAQCSFEQTPFSKIQQNLQHLSALLHQAGIPNELRFNGLLQINLLYDIQHLDYPLMLHLKPDDNYLFGEIQEIIVFDPRTDLFQHLACYNGNGFYLFELDEIPDEFDEYFLSGTPIQVSEIRTTWNNISDIAAALKQAGF